MTAESWRYANCPCKGKEHHPGWVSSDVSDGLLPDCQASVLVPDNRLQDIADAAKCKHKRIDIHFAQHEMHDSFGNKIRPHEYTCKGAPELRSLLEDLNKENNDAN